MSNVYGDPYVPDFAKQRPRIQQQTPTPVVGRMIYDQIQSVIGFEGAREFANARLGNGASCIIAEGDPNIARIYVVAKDQNGAVLLSGYDLTRIEEPKPITMQDISTQLSDIQNRIKTLEEKTDNDKPVYLTPGATVTNSATAPTAGSKQPAVPKSDGDDKK